MKKYQILHREEVGELAGICDSEYFLKKDGTIIPVNDTQLKNMRYGRELSVEEIARCEKREKELHDKMKKFKEDGVMMVKMVPGRVGGGKDYEEMFGFCFYVKDLIRKKYLTVRPLAGNDFVPVIDMEQCERFISRPRDWF